MLIREKRKRKEKEPGGWLFKWQLGTGGSKIQNE
jgi:hypothetical protein